MGLDMYLSGVKWLCGEEPPIEDGFEVDERRLKLGYWRKHPDLHGFIVREFAKGVDDCQEITLNREALIKILRAVDNDELPKTSGFFFGESTPDRKGETIKTIVDAIKWLDAQPDFKTAGEFRSVVYRASW